MSNPHRPAFRPVLDSRPIMTSHDPIPYSGSPLLRGRPAGADPRWYDTARADPKARFIAFHDLRVLAQGQRPAFVTAAQLVPDGETVFLGCLDDTPFFAANVSTCDETRFEAIGPFIEVRAAASQFSLEDLAIVGHGRALIDWHDRHGFCARCGAPTRAIDGGARRQCETCETEHFPRTDPVVIMLVAHGDRALLGRQSRMPPGLYTTLAGFVEQGETIEEAVAREIHEEAGIRIANVRYFASQPWPFPSSLMIGCFADATSETIRVDRDELEDARWFSRREVEAMIARPFAGSELPFGPPRFAIARRLLEAWVGARE